MMKRWRIYFEDGTYVDLDDDQAAYFRDLTWVKGNDNRKIPIIDSHLLKLKVIMIEKIN